MRSLVLMAGLLILANQSVVGMEEPHVLAKVTPLPIALNNDFQFRKTTLYFLSENERRELGQNTPEKPGRLAGTAPSSKTSTVQEASLRFERQYRLFGAVTALDRRQRFGHYFDFFWRAKRPANVTVRLEYRQEKLHAHVQAQEISYQNVRGTRKTEFRVVGDDYFDDGRVIAWRCLLIENGQIVAENRSYLWE